MMMIVGQRLRGPFDFRKNFEVLMVKIFTNVTIHVSGDVGIPASEFLDEGSESGGAGFHLHWAGNVHNFHKGIH